VLRPPPPGRNTSCAAHALDKSTKRAAQRAPLHAQCGSAPQGAGHLSCFLRDQLYPGIRKQKREKAGQGVDIAREVISGKEFVCWGRED